MFGDVPGGRGEPLTSAEVQATGELRRQKLITLGSGPLGSKRLPRDKFIDLEVFSADEFVMESVRKDRLMRFSTAAMELFWCTALFNYVVCTEYPKVQESGALQWDIMAEERSRNALLLMNWALEKVDAKRCSLWPKDLPRPDFHAKAPSDVFFAICVNNLRPLPLTPLDASAVRAPSGPFYCSGESTAYFA
jgi:hypothetical protein